MAQVKHFGIGFIVIYALIMSGTVTMWADQSGIGVQLNGFWGYYYDETEYYDGSEIQ
jgi:hypothetical protein